MDMKVKAPNGAESIFAGRGFIKRDGSVVAFNPEKIALAIQRAYLDVNKGQVGERMKAVVDEATSRVVNSLLRDTQRTHFPVEDVQDQVELALMRMSEHELARGFILFRAKQATRREEERVGCGYTQEWHQGADPRARADV